MNKSTLRYVAALLLFGSNGIVASMITMTSREIVMFRTIIGSIFLIILYLVSGQKFTFLKHRRSFVFLILSGCSMGVSWLFLFEAYQRIGVSIASLGYYCGPVIVMALAPVLFHEKLTRQKLICFFAVFLGIILVNSNAFHESADWIGIFCALMSALMYASMVSCNKKAEEISGMENATLQLTIAFLAVFIYVVYQQGLHFDLQSSDLLPLLILGFVNTGIGCFLYFSSIGKLRVQTIAILGYLEPLSAILFSVIFLQEYMLPLQIAGAVLILSGAMGAEIGGRRR